MYILPKFQITTCIQMKIKVPTETKEKHCA